jgi:hypothetical protein
LGKTSVPESALPVTANVVRDLLALLVKDELREPAFVDSQGAAAIDNIFELAFEGNAAGAILRELPVPEGSR